jgi:hypothetical protein
VAANAPVHTPVVAADAPIVTPLHPKRLGLGI